MKISDLSYLKVVSESSTVGGNNAVVVASYQLTKVNDQVTETQVTETISGSPYTKQFLPDGTTLYVFGNSANPLNVALVTSLVSVS